MLETNEVKELLTQFDQSTLTEFQLKKNNFELYLNKNTMSGIKSAAEISQPVNTETAAVPLQAEPLKSEQLPSQPQKVAGVEIVSPLVGVVYLKPNPEKPDLKQVGDTVKKGEVVCIVEAMKVMNEIVSDIDGEIVEVLVENEQIVEFNQPLFRVKEGK